jgi:hypothetical protein
MGAPWRAPLAAGDLEFVNGRGYATAEFSAGSSAPSLRCDAGSHVIFVPQLP